MICAAPVMIGLSLFIASRSRSSIRAFSIDHVERHLAPLHPLDAHDRRRAPSIADCRNVAFTGSSQVLPLVPSTTAAKVVDSATGLPASVTMKFGVIVLPLDADPLEHARV